MDLIFETIKCNELDKRRLAIFQLTFATADWWEAEKAMIGAEAVRGMPWEAFKIRFLEKYFPEEERDQEEKNFLSLVQGNMTIREYTTQFERLSRFAGHMVDTQPKRVKRFHQGLNSHLRHMMVGHLGQTFESVVRFAVSLEKDSQMTKQLMSQQPPLRNLAYQQRNFQPQSRKFQSQPSRHQQG